MNQNKPTHSMVTRSKKKKDNQPKEFEIKPLPPQDDEVDEYGNLNGFIDYECEEEFDERMFKKELSRLRGRSKRQTSSPLKNKNKKKKKKNTTDLSDIFLSYMLMNVIDKGKKTKKSQNMIISQLILLMKKKAWKKKIMMMMIMKVL